MGTNVSEEPAVSVFRGEVGDSNFLQNVSTVPVYYIVAVCYIPEYQTLILITGIIPYMDCAA